MPNTKVTDPPCGETTWGPDHWHVCCRRGKGHTGMHLCGEELSCIYKWR